MSSFLDNNRGLVDFDQKSLAIAAASIAFNPIFWNTVARQGKFTIIPLTTQSTH
ncbi:hypothetical protein SS1G_14417 [Sclerotinia sclerotiorum 1980 UF-70]|uniref:Uncharacterized protein n=1 Tax=Sclerotinia sclerotiorum (strain ATCC 18683 / 1980 / Ss-1) TaxID=665079 RepID=A7F9Y6_SCLS1|nr:hypothetical protein SS1G_14417 [Sclerotinia sclerotiorum 1980 UF-70]EDO00547.1 hypothetical protein SS1G_14417 [Sclerotinia sclerotiorum 1980 UF-70]